MVVFRSANMTNCILGPLKWKSVLKVDIIVNKYFLLLGKRFGISIKWPKNTGQMLLYSSIRSHLAFIQPYRRPDFSSFFFPWSHYTAVWFLVKEVDQFLEIKRFWLELKIGVLDKTVLISASSVCSPNSIHTVYWFLSAVLELKALAHSHSVAIHE